MTVSISNMAQVWMSNTNTYNGIAMSISTMGYGANTRSRLLKLNVDGNTKFDIDVNGNITTANSLTTNTIVASNITTSGLTVNNRNITKGSMPSGSILQVVQTVKKDTWTSAGTGGTTFYDVTGFTASITPTSTTSKILVNVCLHISTGYWEVQGRLTRGGSAITDTYGNARGSRTQCSFIWNVYSGGTSGYNIMPVYYQYLDSPASTSTQTYGIQLNPYGGYSLAVNYNVYSDYDSSDYYGTPSSTITLMEIAQ